MQFHYAQHGLVKYDFHKDTVADKAKKIFELSVKAKKKKTANGFFNFFQIKGFLGRFSSDEFTSL